MWVIIWRAVDAHIGPINKLAQFALLVGNVCLRVGRTLIGLIAEEQTGPTRLNLVNYGM
jgi:hypothetical protein